MQDKELVVKIKSITKCTHEQAMDVLGLICEIKQQVHMQAAYSVQDIMLNKIITIIKNCNCLKDIPDELKVISNQRGTIQPCRECYQKIGEEVYNLLAPQPHNISDKADRLPVCQFYNCKFASSA